MTTPHTPAFPVRADALMDDSGSAFDRAEITTAPMDQADMGLDVDAVVEGIRKTEPVIACALETMRAFGLRESEAIQLQPRVSDKGDYLLVYRGTKGGKPRTVPFSKDPERLAWQKSVLATAKEHSNAHPQGLLALEGVTLGQMKNRLRHVLRGNVARSGAVVTPHSLRSQYATDLFRELTGLSAPVLRQLPQHVYAKHQAPVHAALVEISRRLGHERPRFLGPI